MRNTHTKLQIKVRDHDAYHSGFEGVGIGEFKNEYNWQKQRD
jgi:hypothetical protein